MTRLSRQESQQLTRHTLIESAEKEIIRVGIYEASIRQICDSAGYTLGAFYSNFTSKDELLLEVVDLHTKRKFDALKTVITATASLNKKEILEKIAEWLQQLQINKALLGLSLEFNVYANHNENFKKQCDENKKKWHYELAKLLEKLFENQQLTPRNSYMQMAVGLAAMWSGFAIEGTVHGVDPADKIIPIFLEALLDSSIPLQQTI
jgi:Transcriptional regulator